MASRLANGEIGLAEGGGLVATPSARRHFSRPRRIIASYSSPAGSGTERGSPLGICAAEHTFVFVISGVRTASRSVPTLEILAQAQPCGKNTKRTFELRGRGRRDAPDHCERRKRDVGLPAPLNTDFAEPIPARTARPQSPWPITAVAALTPTSVANSFDRGRVLHPVATSRRPHALSALPSGLRSLCGW